MTQESERSSVREADDLGRLFLLHYPGFGSAHLVLVSQQHQGRSLSRSLFPLMYTLLFLSTSGAASTSKPGARSCAVDAGTLDTMALRLPSRKSRRNHFWAFRC